MSTLGTDPTRLYVRYAIAGDVNAVAEAIRVEQTIEFPADLAPEWIQQEVVGRIEDRQEQTVVISYAAGVYAGWLERLDLPRGDPERRLPSAISVGTNPTFDDVPVRLLEAHVLDRTDLDLYHEQVGVDFVARLRGNVRFESVEELLTQIGRDVDASRSILLG